MKLSRMLANKLPLIRRALTGAWIETVKFLNHATMIATSRPHGRVD